MISAEAVTTALLAHLTDELDVPVGDHTAPTPAPTLYHVLELAPGSTLESTVGRYDAARTLRYRIRTVAALNNIAASRQAAQDHADRAMAAVMSRRDIIAGDGWELGGRRLIADTGAITDSGPAANVARDYQVHVARGPAAAPPGS